MSKKTKAARKLWFKRNSKVLTRKIRRNSKKIYKYLKDISDMQKNIGNTLQSLQVDGKNGIQNVLKTSIIDTKKTMDYTYHNFVYLKVIEKRMIKGLKKVVDKIEDITKIIQDHPKITIASGADLEKLNKRMHNFKDLYRKMKNIIKIEKKMARDLRKEHQKRRDKNYFQSLHKQYKKIKNASKDLKGEIKKEKKDEKELKHDPKKLKKVIKDLEKDNKDKKKKKELKKILEEISEQIKIEIDLQKEEVNNILLIDKKLIPFYFDILGVKNYFKKLLEEMEDIYDTEYLEELVEEYKEMEEIEKEHADFNYYIDKWMKKELKDADLKDVSDNARNIEKLERHYDKEDLEKAA